MLFLVSTYLIIEGHELRIEVNNDKNIKFFLIDGNAEIFGSTMNVGRSYIIKGEKISIFALEASTIRIEGNPNFIYHTQDSLMLSYFKIYEVIEELWTSARESKSQAPRILLTGPIDSGKSTLTRLLSNLSFRMGWKTAIVDLDVDQGILTLPGCISAALLDKPWDIENGISTESLIAFYYGHIKTNEAIEQYRALVEKLASILEKKTTLSHETASLGMFINTIGLVDGIGYELLLHQIDTFACNVVIVIGQDRLYSQLLTYAQNMTSINGHSLIVMKVPRSGGVLIRDINCRGNYRDRRVHEYFFGINNTFIPTLVNSAPFSTLKIYSIGENKSPSSALPMGASQIYDTFKVSPLTISTDIENTILAITYASTPEEAMLANVAGFIQILDVDMKNKLVSYRSPCAGELPGKVLIAGHYKVHTINQ